MRYRYYETTSAKKILTYCLYVIFVLWIFTTLILGYQFLIKSSTTTNKKGGTFVEAIFNQVSYLPYLKNDWQSLFYQSFLFDACVNYDELNTEGLKWNNCKITTQDYQTYYVSLPTNPKVWSDGKVWGLEDLLFTYENIIKQNTWSIRALNTYQEIQVSQEEDKLKIVFPTSTTDNNYFFTSYILPKHVLEHADVNMYRTIFAANPITSGCGKIAPKTKDNQSLVFDLTKCEDTNLGYYQIKNYDEFELFSRSVLENNNTLIDTYANQITLDGYQRINIIKSQILTLFFNTKSDKLKVRMRRALGGLLNSHLYASDYSKHLKKYDEPLLSLFYSDGSNIKEFINRLGMPDENSGVQQEDLRDSGIQELKKSITINGVERKFVFFTQKPANNLFNLEIKFSNQFETIKITDNYKNNFTPKNYKKTDKKVVYPLEVGKNLREGLNQYRIQGTIKGKTYTIADIDLYLLSSTTPVQNEIDEATNTKIKVVYYNNLESNFAIKQIREILTNAGILENFLFEQISSPEELEGKLVLGDYDILLNSINIGMKKDVLKILLTDDPLINPSKYTNPQLTTLFKQYTKNPQNQQLMHEINQIFAQDMPFVILGYPFDFINIKASLLTGDNNWYKGLSQSGFATTDLYEYNRRNHLYNKITLVQNTVIDFTKLKNVRDFLSDIVKTAEFSWFKENSSETQTKINGSLTGGKIKKSTNVPLTTGLNTEETSQIPATGINLDPENPFAGLIKNE